MGQFVIDSSGDVAYDVTAVPEPSTYGLLAGAGLLAFALRRQFNGQNA
jgi:hypothetical protein